MKPLQSKKIKRRIKYYILLLKSPKTRKSKIKFLAVFMVLSAFGVVLFNDSFYIYSFNIDILMKTLMSLILVIGLSYLLFVDTNDFKFGNEVLNKRSYLGLKYLYNETVIKTKEIVLRKKRGKYPLIDLSKFICTSDLKKIVYETDNFNSIYKNDILELLNEGDIKSQISSISWRSEDKFKFICNNENNILIFDPIFNFFHEIIEDGIYALYNKDRRIFLNYIIRHFKKGDEDFEFENLRKNYQRWLLRQKTNSDNKFHIKLL